MSLEISEKQLLIHVLNDLPPDYDLQVTWLERRIEDEKDILTVSAITQILIMVKHQMKWRFIVDSSKENAEIVVKLDRNCSNVKVKDSKWR
jgi:hypothetical protein